METPNLTEAVRAAWYLALSFRRYVRLREIQAPPSMVNAEEKILRERLDRFNELVEGVE